MALVLRAEELRGHIGIEEAVGIVEKAFADQSHQPRFNIPRQRAFAGNRRLTVHSGGCSGLRVAGSFVHYERFSYTESDQHYAVFGPRVYTLYDSETAQLLAIIVGSLPLYPFEESGEIATETALTSAVGTRLLVRPATRVMTLLGTGRQARRHLFVFNALLKLQEVRVYSRDVVHRREFCGRMQGYVDAELVPVEKPEMAVRGADLVVCATNSNVPVIDGRWLSPGVHVTSIVGSNSALVAEGLVKVKRREVDDETVRRADLIVATLRQQAIQDEQGDLFDPVQCGILSWEDVKDLGDLVAGKIQGRTSADQITLFKQNCDQGVGYTALAQLAYEKALTLGLGISV